MEVDAGAARNEPDLAGVAGHQLGLSSERHDGDPLGGRGPIAFDSQR
jgi:hypothetical protein